MTQTRKEIIDRSVGFCNAMSTLLDIPLKFSNYKDYCILIVKPRKIFKDTHIANYIVDEDCINYYETYDDDLYNKYVGKIHALFSLYKLISIGFPEK